MYGELEHPKLRSRLDLSISLLADIRIIFNFDNFVKTNFFLPTSNNKITLTLNILTYLYKSFKDLLNSILLDTGI